MARRKRTLSAYSQSKLTIALTSTLAARMGPLAESPLGQFIVTSAALDRASEWHSKRKTARAIFEEALKQLGKVPPMDRAKVNALATAASKVVNAAFARRLDKDADEALDEVLMVAQTNTGAPPDYVNAVKKAALTVLGQLTAGAGQ